MTRAAAEVGDHQKADTNLRSRGPAGSGGPASALTIHDQEEYAHDLAAKALDEICQLRTPTLAREAPDVPRHGIIGLSCLWGRAWVPLGHRHVCVRRAA